MFFSCTSLISLDLRNFNTSSVRDMDEMFYCCTSLIYLNLISFTENKVPNIYDIFYGINSNLIYCINNAPNIKSAIQQKSSKNNECAYICFNEYKIIYLMGSKTLLFIALMKLILQILHLLFNKKVQKMNVQIYALMNTE